MITLDVVINVGLSPFFFHVSSFSRFLKLQGVQNSLYESLTFKITPKYRIFIFQRLIFNDIKLSILESLNLTFFWISLWKTVSILLFECTSVKNWESMSSPKQSIIPPPFRYLSDQVNMRCKRSINRTILFLKGEIDMFRKLMSFHWSK